MVTVEVYAYREDGEDCEDFVIRENGALYPLGASDDEQDREKTARRCLQGMFIALPLEDNMSEDAVLVATYNFQ